MADTVRKALIVGIDRYERINPLSGCVQDAVNTAVSKISRGVTILTASTEEQVADERDEGGVFTSLFRSYLPAIAAAPGDG